MDEQAIKQKLEEKFSFLKGAVVITRPRRIFVDVPVENFKQVFDFAVNVLGFKALTAITGLDETATLAAMYHLASAGTLLNVRTRVPRDNPKLDTVSKIFPNADIFERELIDLFGIQVQGLVEGPRYPLTDDWPKDEFPLRKDWVNRAARAYEEDEKKNA